MERTTRTTRTTSTAAAIGRLIMAFVIGFTLSAALRLAMEPIANALREPAPVEILPVEPASAGPASIAQCWECLKDTPPAPPANWSGFSWHLPIIQTAPMPQQVDEPIKITAEPTPEPENTPAAIAQRRATPTPRPRAQATPRPVTSYTTSAGRYCSSASPASWQNPGCNARPTQSSRRPAATPRPYQQR